MAEAVTTQMRLRVVRDLQENEAGATLELQDGARAHLPRRDPTYARHLRLARRSQERQHPVGVSIGANDAITELSRADNDIPLALAPESSGATRVLFQGHDGVFQLKADHPDHSRIGAVLSEAVRTQSAVWFLADKPDLVLLDVSGVAKACAAATSVASTSNNEESPAERCK